MIAHNKNNGRSRQMKKTHNILTSLFLCLGLSPLVSGAELVSHDFNDGRMGPFVECTTKSPNYAKVVNKRLETFWTERGWDGSRVSKGAEACHELRERGEELETQKEGWMGFIINVDEGHRRDSESGVSQIFGFEDNRNIFTWEAVLDLIDGGLVLTHRAGSGTNKITHGDVYPNMPYGVDVSVVIQFILSNRNQGKVEVWIDGKSAYRANNINFGLGNFNNNDEQTDDTYTTFKVGQYDYQDEDYRNNEERIIRYDNLSWYTGKNGYSIVDPDEGTLPEPVASGDFISMTKSNSTSFSIDGNNGAADGQNVYLWSYKSSNKNQHWEEINRGGDFYSYKKRGTNHCLDGGNGGANRQPVYLWTCSTNNQNQHWKKVKIGNNYRLEKRNAPRYSIDGNNGGSNSQDVYLYKSSDTNRNQQWIFKEE